MVSCGARKRRTYMPDWWSSWRKRAPHSSPFLFSAKGARVEHRCYLMPPVSLPCSSKLVRLNRRAQISCTRAASELSLRDKSNDNHVLIARLVVGDAVNSILSYEKKGDVVSANSLRDDIDRLCALLQCQPGDLVEYKEVKPDA